MISVVLTTHNEAANLERCLAAVKSFAGEMIVVDGESSDGTAELAASLGAQVIRTTNKSNFHINKQQAIDAAQGELILQLDADEVVDDELAKWLTQLEADRVAGTLPEQPVAWYIRRKNYFFGSFLRKGGQYPDPVIRVLKKGKAWLPQKNVHEQMAVSGETGTTAGHLLHYPYPNFASYMVKFNRYTSFEAERQAGLGTLPDAKFGWAACTIRPLKMFFLLFLRHKGFVDGWAGFVFALMSALHHPFVYLKLRERQSAESSQ